MIIFKKVTKFLVLFIYFWPSHMACGFLVPQESESESHSVVSDSLRPHGLCTSWNSPGQNTGVGSLSLLLGIFPTQGSNPGLLHCRQILYQLNYQENPNKRFMSKWQNNNKVWWAQKSEREWWVWSPKMVTLIKKESFKEQMATLTN